MTHWTQIIVENALGEQAPLPECEVFCGRAGEMDYTDPVALRFPDASAITGFNDEIAPPKFFDEDGNPVKAEDIDWEGSEPPEKVEYPIKRKFKVEVTASERILVTVEIDQTEDMDDYDVHEQACEQALHTVTEADDPALLDGYRHFGWETPSSCYEVL